MENKKSLRARLQTARVELQKLHLQKSGINKYSNYTYFELSDFLPSINELCEKHGLLTIFNIDNDVAKLSILDSENESANPIEFTTFIVKPSAPKGTNELQNLGSIHTYLRRYLLLNAFEIVEIDMVELQKKEEERVLNEKIELVKKEFSEAKTAREFTLVKNKHIQLFDSNLVLKEFSVDCFNKIRSTLPFAIDALLCSKNEQECEKNWDKFPQFHHEQSFIDTKNGIKF